MNRVRDEKEDGKVMLNS